MLETSDFVHGSAMWSLSLVMSECSLSVRGQGHVSNFYTVDLEISPQQVVGIQVIYITRPSSVCLWHLRQWEPTRSHHGWVHIVYHALPPTKSPTLYHRLVRTCRISSFCTVAWQLARFQLTRRIARSLGDSWASCLQAGCPSCHPTNGVKALKAHITCITCNKTHLIIGQCIDYSSVDIEFSLSSGVTFSQ